MQKWSLLLASALAFGCGSNTLPNIIQNNPVFPPGTTRVSVDSNGVEGNDTCFEPFISADARFVTFFSFSSNLVANDTNGREDIFVHDRQSGATTRVSIDSAGVQANDGSSNPSLSADGRFVAFESIATNLVANDTNGVLDIFVHDRQTGNTSRVSLDSGGAEANANSFFTSLSADGRFVAFESNASNLVANDTNGVIDLFVHDRETGVTSRVSVDSAGVQGNQPSTQPSLSADGRLVAFRSVATNLVANDTNGGVDIFVHDRQTGITNRVSLGPAGVEANASSDEPSISADGRFVVFDSTASNLVANDTNGLTDVFVHDRQTGTTSLVSLGPGAVQGNGPSLSASISADGRFVTFRSTASNLVDNDTNGEADVFVHDRQSGTTSRVSVDSNGAQANASSLAPVISADGLAVAFSSSASNLVGNDNNGSTDIFVNQRQP